MAHYFDDIFARHVGEKAMGASTPKPPPFRRSSTTRSIGARSDFDTSVDGSEHGDDEEQRKEREESDAHIAKYVSEKLERVRSNGSEEFDNEDEFEAQLDGQ